MDTVNLAAQLETAWNTRRPIEPFSVTEQLADPAAAYEIQRHWLATRLKQGDQLLGRKVGLTSRIMQEQLGVDEPDFGALLASREIKLDSGLGVANSNWFIAPKVEGEIAFLLNRPLEGPGVGISDVFSAIEAVAASIEVIDSRIRDWKIKLPDTVADNASFGAFAVGAWSHNWRCLDLPLAGMALYTDGDVKAVGAGAAALGHPAACVAWLANKLSEMGDRLEAGDIILSGSLAAALPVASGQVVRVEIAGLAPVTLRFDSGEDH